MSDKPQWVQQNIIYQDKLYLYAGETWYVIGERGVLSEAQLDEDSLAIFAKMVKSGRVPLIQSSTGRK